jgi:hypothetical protein
LSHRIGAELTKYLSGDKVPLDVELVVDGVWQETLPLEQFPQESQGGARVTPFLDQNFQNLTFTIYRTPEIHLLPADRDEGFLQRLTVS